MKAAGKRKAKVPPPWPWEMARYCLELPHGTVRHFPAGTYHEQMSTETGQIEMELMRTAYRAWYTFIHLSLGQWGKDEQKFAGWVRAEPERETARLLDDLLSQLWQLSDWALSLLLPSEENGA